MKKLERSQPQKPLSVEDARETDKVSFSSMSTELDPKTNTEVAGDRPSLHASPTFRERKDLQIPWLRSQQVDAQSASAEHGPVMNWDPWATGWEGLRPSLHVSLLLRDKKALQTF
jgi:hypothetical protein